MNASKLTYASVGIGLLLAYLYFRIFFQDRSEFKEDTKNAAKFFWMRKSYYWPFRWLYDEDDFQWSAMKLFVWVALSVGCGILAYYQLPEWLPRYFR
jgi:hypothetical protein